MKAISINVYRNTSGYDCTNGGISSKYRTLLLLCDDGWIKVDENNLPENAVKVVKRQACGKEIVCIEPCKPASGVGYMFGGNYAASSDGRFSALVGIYGAVAIHDRDESQETYDLLSR